MGGIRCCARLRALISSICAECRLLFDDLTENDLSEPYSENMNRHFVDVQTFELDFNLRVHELRKLSSSK